jgi:hypothetical protein
VAHSSVVPSVFIGSSTESITVAQSLQRFLRRAAKSTVWNLAFSPGEWTLQGILDHAQDADFGAFVFAPDDKSVIRHKGYSTVRDNVLFEVGVFMGAIGPKRTFLLWPSGLSKLRHPSDLLGITTISYDPPKLGTVPQFPRVLAAVKTLGPALRSGYNEIQSLDRLLDQREQIVDGRISKSHKEIIATVAAQRNRPWFPETPVKLLMRGIREDYRDKIVDNIYWWLIVDGIVTFDNIDVWTKGDFHWKKSVDLAVFTARGAVWLNQLRSGRLSKPAAERRTEPKSRRKT